jgi:glucose-6-phosphate isomerase
MSRRLEFDPGLALNLAEGVLVFEYGEGMFGPVPEIRSLDAIRPSLRDPHCKGPDPA